MHTALFPLLLSTCFPLSLAGSIRHKHSHQREKRFDLDHNGIPDLCEVTSGTADCLLGDGSWTKFATATYVSTTASTAAEVTSAADVQTASSATAASSSATSSSLSNVAPAPSSSGGFSLQSGFCLSQTATAASTATLPDASTFVSDNGTKWTLEYVDNLKFTETLQSEGLGSDKCRTSVLGGKVIWNCGDAMCGTNVATCGFSMGPAFYGTDDVSTVNTDNVSNVNDNTFIQPWSGDETPQAPQSIWGMDTSNVAPINETTGVAFGWEAWRGASDGSSVSRGVAVAAVTLGDTKPIATRVGPLISGPNAIQMGLLAVLSECGYIYTYSIGSAPSQIIVGRVSANDDIFDASKYEFLSSSDYTTWETPGSLPDASTTSYGMKTSAGGFNCAVYGSIFWSSYFGKYVIVCNRYMQITSMYTSDTPYGPWSDTYTLLSGVDGYGSMAHPEYGVNPLYFSLGPNGPFYMYKLTFHY